MRRIIALLTAVLLGAALFVSALSPGATASPVAAAKPVHDVSYDSHSLMIDGHRVMVEAAEFHYFRLPSPSLWRDILEKYKAAGFNTVSVYFDWAYHSPKPGVYDFSGVRDVDRFLSTAEQAGLFVIARPGPYINAETTGGGFPAWLKKVPGRARSSAPGYTAAFEDWLHHVDKYISKHQITRGGSVIAYQAENEYATNTDRQYMADLESTAHSDGINVPITHNQCCDAASWTTDWTQGQGAVDIEGVDGYPQSFECQNPSGSWGPWGEGVTERTRQDTPVFAAEYQAGSIDEYNTGYDGCRELTGVSYMKYFYKNNLINSGATMFSYYMGYGGTSWGWLPQPNDVYTSYDYGSAITESRQLTTKYDEFKRQNYFLQAAAPSLTKTDPGAAPVSSNSVLSAVERANPDNGTQFVLLRHTDRAAQSDDTATLDWTTPDGHYKVPVRLNGRDAKVLVAGYDLGGQRLVYSTSELMTQAAIGGRDVAVLYGRSGEAGQTVLRYSSQPTVRVLSGSVTSSYSGGDLTLNYTHQGLARVLVTGGGRRPLVLLLGTDEEAAKFWRADTAAGPVLVYGTSLLRSAASSGDGVDLRADTAKATSFEVFTGARHVSVNGQPVRVGSTSSGSLLGSLPGPSAVRLPALTGWKTKAEAPETSPGFDDSSWTTADKTTSALPYTPRTQPVLFADDYNFDYGNVWYRGHFTATGSESTVSLNAFTGKRGVYYAWVNGHYLGSAAGGTEADSDTNNPNPGPGSFTIPAGLLKAGDKAVLSVLVENMGHNDDWIADDNRFKQPRGLDGASIDGVSQISWKIQGTLGGENLTDPARGPLNTSGLFGERSGWYLPGFPDKSWSSGAPASVSAGNISWYRTGFTLNLPHGQDSSIGLRFGGTIPSDARVFIYLNGWNLGQYGSLGPQTDFVLPAGLLRQNGQNTLALAVVAGKDTTIPAPSLVDLGTFRGGVPISNVASPGYEGAGS